MVRTARSGKHQPPRRFFVGGLALRLLLVGVVVVAAAAIGMTQRGHIGEAAGPQLKLDAPTKANVGEPVEIQLKVQHAADVAGYSTNVVIDPMSSHFRSVLQRQNDLRKLGRDVVPLGPFQSEDGSRTTVGAYSCPVNACVDAVGKPKKRGGNGTVTLATITIVPDQAGALVVRLDQTKFVDSLGNQVNVDLSQSTVTVQVSEAK